MYQSFTFYHNLLRWLVLASLLVAIYKAYKGYVTKSLFIKSDTAIRSWAAAIANIQLIAGIGLYIQSPLIKYFMSNFTTAIKNFDVTFFAVVHSVLMLIAISLISFGAARSKRKQTDREKFKTMLVWFVVALAIIVITVPWPFSPFANRPYFR